MDTHRGSHPNWEINKQEDRVELRRENALEAVPGWNSADTTIIVDVDERGARVTNPDSTLQATRKADPAANGVELITFLNRELSPEYEESLSSSEAQQQDRLLRALATYRDVPQHIRTQAATLYDQYLDESEKNWITDKANTSAAALFLVERLHERRPQYTDYDINADSLFAKLTGITTSETRCSKRSREIQRTLPINVARQKNPVLDVNRAADSLDLPPGIHQLARKLAENHVDCMPEASAYKPQTIAGAAIYNATRHYNQLGAHDVHLTQSEIASAVSCSAAAIRNQYQAQWDSVADVVQPPTSPA